MFRRYLLFSSLFLGCFAYCDIDPSLYNLLSSIDAGVDGVRYDLGTLESDLEGLSSDFSDYSADSLAYFEAISYLLANDIITDLDDIATYQSQINSYLRSTLIQRIQDVFDVVDTLDENQTHNWSLWLNYWLAYERQFQRFYHNNTNSLNDIYAYLLTLRTNSLPVVVSNSVSVRPDPNFAFSVFITNQPVVSVTNPVTIRFDQQLDGNDWLSNWFHSNWETTLFLTNSLPSLLTNSAFSSASVSASTISNLVDNWADIWGVPGWQISGKDLSVEAWLSEFLSEWNRTFYKQIPPSQTPPPFTDRYSLLNWWGSAGPFNSGISEDNGRYAFSDWIADAFRYFIVNGSNMVVESYQPYNTSAEAEGNGRYGPDWETNLTKAAFAREPLEAVDTTGVETELATFDSGVSEAFGKIDTSSMSGSTEITLIPEISVAGHHVEAATFDFATNETVESYKNRVSSIMVFVWNVIGLCIGFKMFNDFWKCFTQL